MSDKWSLREDKRQEVGEAREQPGGVHLFREEWKGGGRGILG